MVAKKRRDTRNDKHSGNSRIYSMRTTPSQVEKIGMIGNGMTEYWTHYSIPFIATTNGPINKFGAHPSTITSAAITASTTWLNAVGGGASDVDSTM